MKKIRVLNAMAAMCLTALLSACGGGGDGLTPVTLPMPVPVGTVTPPVVAAAYAIPGGLWSPTPGATPAAGNYVYLQSDSGDFVGGGLTTTNTNVDSLIKMSSNGLTISAVVNGNQNWTGGFRLPSAAVTLQAGYFKDLTRTPFADPAVGGIEWTGDGRGCNNIKGWVVIDKIVLSSGALQSIDMRFEQSCDSGPLLHGKIHWSSADTSTPPGPVAPPPVNLWKPPVSFVPPLGNYVYLVSDVGDWIGGGRTELLTPNNSTIEMTTDLTAAMRIKVGGWTGDFHGMIGLTQLQPGYYADLQRYPFHNKAKGGLNWSGNGRGCNTLKGWFVVDKVTYVMGQMTAIDLRFEQHCEGGTTAQRGVIHWAV